MPIECLCQSELREGPCRVCGRENGGRPNYREWGKPPQHWSVQITDAPLREKAEDDEARALLNKGKP